MTKLAHALARALRRTATSLRRPRHGGGPWSTGWTTSPSSELPDLPGHTRDQPQPTPTPAPDPLADVVGVVLVDQARCLLCPDGAEPLHGIGAAGACRALHDHLREDHAPMLNPGGGP